MRKEPGRIANDIKHVNIQIAKGYGMVMLHAAFDPECDACRRRLQIAHSTNSLGFTTRQWVCSQGCNALQAMASFLATGWSRATEGGTPALEYIQSINTIVDQFWGFRLVWNGCEWYRHLLGKTH